MTFKEEVLDVPPRAACNLQDGVYEIEKPGSMMRSGFVKSCRAGRKSTSPSAHRRRDTGGRGGDHFEDDVSIVE